MTAERKQPTTRSVRGSKSPGSAPKNQTGKKDGGRKGLPRILIKAAKFTLVTVLLTLAVAVGLFSWDRWFRYDDALDFQGQWIYAADATEVSVNIDADEIRIADEVSYAYEVDPWSKTVSFRFSDLEGGANYRFTEDRSMIVMCENAPERDWFTEIEVALNLVDVTAGFDPESTVYLKHV